MVGDLTSRNMNNGEKSNKDNPRFRNLRFSNQDNNLRGKSSSRTDKSKNRRFSNPNTLSLKGNLKEGR